MKQLLLASVCVMLLALGVAARDGQTPAATAPRAAAVSRPQPATPAARPVRDRKSVV